MKARIGALSGAYPAFPFLATAAEPDGETLFESRLRPVLVLRCSECDIHATALHLLGLDHENLAYRSAGRDFRLTDVHGKVAREIVM